MNKLHDLRAHLMARIPDLKRNPNQLLTFVEDGQITFHRGNGLSHRYSMPVRVIVTDWRYSADDLVLPILEWLALREPGMDEANTLSFETDIVDKSTLDIGFTVRITERVIVRDTPEGREIEHILPGPELTMNDGAEWTLDTSGPGETNTIGE